MDSIANNPRGESPTGGKQTLSKNQQKKLAKRQKYLEHRGERRKLEREKNKIKKRLQAQQRQEAVASGIVPDTVLKKTTLMKDSCNKFRIVIDMDFEEFMTDAEISKATQQLGRIYSLNRNSTNPCQLYVTSLKGKILDKFQVTNSGYKSWDLNYSDMDYETFFRSINEEKQKCNFVYLSGDADDTLPEVDTLLKDESQIFIIGGLVDHNRHKNLCQTRAVERNIPTAKLPIKENVKLCQRHILSTVAVFEILLHVFGNHKDWKEALVCSIPKRKLEQDSLDKYAESEKQNSTISSAMTSSNEEQKQ